MVAESSRSDSHAYSSERVSPWNVHSHGRRSARGGSVGVGGCAGSPGVGGCAGSSGVDELVAGLCVSVTSTYVTGANAIGGHPISPATGDARGQGPRRSRTRSATLERVVRGRSRTFRTSRAAAYARVLPTSHQRRGEPS